MLAHHFREWRANNKLKKVVFIEMGVGAEGLKRHMKQYQKEFSDVTLVCINPEFDGSYADADSFHLSMGAKEAFLSFMKSY